MSDLDSLYGFCRYYKGEAENPFEGRSAHFWEYEKAWLENGLSRVELLHEYLDAYLAAGLGLFEVEDSTPITLKALLYHRFSQSFNGSPQQAAAPFQEFYKKEYLAK